MVCWFGSCPPFLRCPDEDSGSPGPVERFGSRLFSGRGLPAAMTMLHSGGFGSGPWACFSLWWFFLLPACADHLFGRAKSGCRFSSSPDPLSRSTKKVFFLLGTGAGAPSTLRTIPCSMAGRPGSGLSALRPAIRFVATSLISDPEFSKLRHKIDAQVIFDR